MAKISVLRGQVIDEKLTKVLLRYLAVLLVLINTLSMSEITKDDYLKYRKIILEEEENMFTGSQVNLTKKEEVVNEYLLKLKKDELKESYKDFSKFLPAQSFLLSKSRMEDSKVFQLIKKVPKGASLHTHMLAGVDINYIIQNFTYIDNVYACYNDHNIFKLKMLKNPKQDTNCSWKSLTIFRKEFLDQGLNFDDFLKEKLTLGINDTKLTREDTWAKFKNTFSTLYDLVACRDVFRQYIYQLLEELSRDNVLYTEIRGTFMPLYDLNNTTYDTDEFFKTFIEAVANFKITHPNFVGVKYIHSIYRGVDNSTFRAGLDQILYYKSLYPNFIAGLDFVGMEEDGKMLVDFHEELIGISKDLPFYFHAGETNQYGHTDLNLADAILLNSSRIGHGFALAKHPNLLKAAKDRNIAIELSPISNQVLKLNEDPRNHPATVLLSKGHPVVICNDDPSAWAATGLSYDWYVVFMSMTWENHGLKVLKMFAEDSITYSAMNETEKKQAFQIWRTQWDTFIEETINNI